MRRIRPAIAGVGGCTRIFREKLRPCAVEVQMGPVLDGAASHRRDVPSERSVRVALEAFIAGEG